MQLHFPDIADHDVSPISGFLPPQPPLTRLPEYYAAWDDLAERLAESIASKSIRTEVDALPVLSASKLTTKPQLQRAFVVLGFLVHAYVWCEASDRPEPNVPPQLGEPYLKVCERLGMQPTLSYAGLCLWNWTVKSKGHEESNGDATRMKDLGRLEDLDCLVSFTGTRDEAVFYVVPIMVEAEGGRLVNLLFEAMKAALQGDVEVVVSALEETRDTLPRMSALVKLLHEQCDAKVFFDIVRPFFPGAKGMEDKGMPDGVVFHQSDGSKVCARCVGGSAAQSSDFQFLDAALGVRHRPVGAATGETVFDEMRSYMPREHRDFLDAVESLPPIRSLVESRAGDKCLSDVYNSCLQQLSNWRSRHTGVVITHIVNPARSQKSEVAKAKPEQVTNGLSVKDESALKGTGGSALIPFLKQARQETLDTRVLT